MDPHTTFPTLARLPSLSTLTPSLDVIGSSTSPRMLRSRHPNPIRGVDKSSLPESSVSRPQKEEKSKGQEQQNLSLTEPFSVLTKDMDVPLLDISARVNRSAESRHQQVIQAKGKIARPMNSFMLYRSAYAERAKRYFHHNNHQAISSLSGESWKMETEEVKNEYKEWARIERINHQAAHPNYKFAPSKGAKKRKRGEHSEDEASKVASDAGGEYLPPRASHSRPDIRAKIPRLDQSVSSVSLPYYDSEGLTYTPSSLGYSPAQSSPYILDSERVDYTYGLQAAQSSSWHLFPQNSTQMSHAPPHVNRYGPYLNVPGLQILESQNISDIDDLTMDKILPLTLPQTSSPLVHQHNPTLSQEPSHRLFDYSDSMSLNPANQIWNSSQVYRGLGSSNTMPQHPPAIDPFLDLNVEFTAQDIEDYKNNNPEYTVGSTNDSGLSDMPEYYYGGPTSETRFDRQ